VLLAFGLRWARNNDLLHGDKDGLNHFVAAATCSSEANTEAHDFNDQIGPCSAKVKPIPSYLYILVFTFLNLLMNHCEIDRHSQANRGQQAGEDYGIQANAPGSRLPEFSSRMS
jgi:hypothetical protein